METKRMAVAFGISAAILILWTIVFPPEKPPAAPDRPVPTAVQATASPSPGAPAGAAAAAATPEAAVAPTVAEAPARPAQPPIVAAERQELVVRSSLYTARLSNEGGSLVSFRLARFSDHAGEPLELVRRDAPFPGRSLSLDAADPFLAAAASSLFVPSVETEGNVTLVTFRFRDAAGNGVTRSYTFRHGYVVSTAFEREGPSRGGLAVVIGPGIGTPSKAELESQYTKPGSSVALSASASVSRKAHDGLKEPVVLEKGSIAAGLEDNYFLSAFLPGSDAIVTLRPVSLTFPAAAGTAAKPSNETQVVLSGGSSLKADVYFGPKDIAILETVRPGMDKLIDYGWFAILVKPLLWGLKGLYGFSQNWGIAIILITVVIKILLFPLTYKQLVSMKKMSAMQPKVEAIRAKWAAKIKQDAQARVKMNEEMMAMYKQEGVNPAGGCLPLLLQMPILIAFYNLLAHAIELRHAPFWLWIQDLSAKDPYYVTPILMTLTMWIQQQMTPATGDATTKKVMAIMPFVFGFMFKDMPSGLVLYWLVQNVLTIAQQLLLERYTDLTPKAAAKKA